MCSQFLHELFNYILFFSYLVCNFSEILMQLHSGWINSLRLVLKSSYEHK